MSKILWVDIETTGTDVNSELLVQIGAVVTDDTPELHEQGAFQVTFATEPHDWLDVDPYVIDMHTRNGLMADSLADGLDYFEAFDLFLDFIERHFNINRQIPLGGSGVGHFDRTWLVHHMSDKLGDLLHRVMPKFRYWSYDVGCARRFAKIAGLDLEAYGYDGANAGANKAHTGLADIRDHVSEARAVILAFQAADGQEIGR